MSTTDNTKMIRSDTEDTESTNNTTYKTVANDIAQFASVLDGSSFTNKHIDDQFNYKTRDAKRYRWQVIEEYVKNGTFKKVKTGVYRKVEEELEEIDILGAKEGSHIDIVLPLEMDKYIRIYRKSVTIVAGSPGSGKTGFMYNTIMLNLEHPDGIVLWTNDMTDVEMKERLMNYQNPLPDPLPFKAFYCDSNFGDAVAKFPNSINFIDYLDMDSEVYLVGKEITDIDKALKEGIAIVGIQKRPNQDVGIGGIFTWKRPKYYFSIDVEESVTGLTRRLKVVKCRGRKSPQVNPHGMVFRYDLAGGIRCKLRE